MSAATFGFALAFVALIGAAASWLTYSTLDRRIAQLRDTNAASWKHVSSHVVSLRKELATVRAHQPPGAAEVAALAEDVARLAATHRRFQGRFDQYVTQNEPADSSTPSAPNGLDPDLAAEIALQNAPSAAPGGR